MNIKEIIILSIESIWDRKVRSILTILMVMVGSALLVAVGGIGAGFTVTFTKQFASLASNIVFVFNSNQAAGANTLKPPAPKLTISNAIAKTIASLPAVTDVIPHYRGTVIASTPSETRTESLVAMDPKKLKVIAPTVTFQPGSILSNNPNSLIVATDVANPSGDPYPFLPLDKSVKLTYNYNDPSTGQPLTQSKNFVVTAIMDETGSTSIDNNMYITLDSGDQLFQKSGRYDSLYVIAKNPDFVDSVVDEIYNLYGNNVGYNTVKAILETIKAFTTGFSAFLTSIGIVALVVGAVGVITTLYTSVIERTREIGTLKAIGAQNKNILALFLFEALLIGIFGASTGLVTGVGFGYILSNMMSTSASPSIHFSGAGSHGSGSHGSGGGGGASHKSNHTVPIYHIDDMMRVWFISVGLSTVAGIMPAFKASRMLPIAALRTQ